MKTTEKSALKSIAKKRIDLIRTEIKNKHSNSYDKFYQECVEKKLDDLKELTALVDKEFRKLAENTEKANQVIIDYLESKGMDLRYARGSYYSNSLFETGSHFRPDNIAHNWATNNAQQVKIEWEKQKRDMLLTLDKLEVEIEEKILLDDVEDNLKAILDKIPDLDTVLNSIEEPVLKAIQEN